MYRYLIIGLLCLSTAACVPPYKPTNVKKPKDDTTVEVVKPHKAYDQYTLDTAANFRQLAKRCADGEFEFVSELIDASKKLDVESKNKRNKAIDSIFKEALGNNKLDPKAAVDVLLKVANDLDPDGKVEIVIPQEKEKNGDQAGNVRPQSDLVVDLGEPSKLPIGIGLIYCQSTPHQVHTNKTSYRVRPTGQQMLAMCRHDCQPYGIAGNAKDHLVWHGCTYEQLRGMSHRELYLLHENIHAGVVDPNG